MKKSYKKPTIVFTEKESKISKLPMAYCGCGC